MLNSIKTAYRTAFGGSILLFAGAASGKEVRQVCDVVGSYASGTSYVTIDAENRTVDGHRNGEVIRGGELASDVFVENKYFIDDLFVGSSSFTMDRNGKHPGSTTRIDRRTGAFEMRRDADNTVIAKESCVTSDAAKKLF